MKTLAAEATVRAASMSAVSLLAARLLRNLVDNENMVIMMVVVTIVVVVVKIMMVMPPEGTWPRKGI